MPDLMHYGILGMKWGVRRSKEQLERDKRASERKSSGFFDKTIKTGKDKSPISPAEKIGKESEKILENSMKLSSRMSAEKQRKTRSKDMDSMTNEELKNAIERMRLEDAYADLDSKRISRGMSSVTSILETVGTVVAIGASAASIATTVKGLRSS